MGVNLRGLKPQVLWQMYVTHFPQFEKLAYIHVTIETYSHVVTPSERTDGAVKDVLQLLFI
ncbi:hypothetical protein ACQP3J_28415, partial [Escherichia coli]